MCGCVVWGGVNGYEYVLLLVCCGCVICVHVRTRYAVGVDVLILYFVYARVYIVGM